MSSRRVLKASEAIREVVSMAILVELRDPRIQDVTVTYVEVSPDMRTARVNVSVMGEEQKQQLAIKGLQNSAGFLQKKVADRIQTRYTPKLVFRLDKGIKNAAEISRILEEVLPDRDQPLEEDSGTAPDDSALPADDSSTEAKPGTG